MENSLCCGTSVVLRLGKTGKGVTVPRDTSSAAFDLSLFPFFTFWFLSRLFHTRNLKLAELHIQQILPFRPDEAEDRILPFGNFLYRILPLRLPAEFLSNCCLVFVKKVLFSWLSPSPSQLTIINVICYIDQSKQQRLEVLQCWSWKKKKNVNPLLSIKINLST